MLELYGVAGDGGGMSYRLPPPPPRRVSTLQTAEQLAVLEACIHYTQHKRILLPE